MNLASSFIDAEGVYGSTPEEAAARRIGKHGKITKPDMVFEPPFPTEDHARHSNRLLERVWATQHNRLAAVLEKLNPSWDDEQLFQEARRIVIAQIQFVTLNEYLPLLLGEETMAKYELSGDTSEFAEFYHTKIKPGTLNSFAAGIGEVLVFHFALTSKNFFFLV
ncbi:hypothetical protein ANCCAN_06990 [Ancylostoma caninum]|uniref:Uncharacterized protein n=1 Tax=Ancylostoma caninum TaxID=29170 RepID=A0A368GVB9_ANCCA|nr:hypothetical protein ANCCAN_06990 [Ancylostoma caninum]